MAERGETGSSALAFRSGGVELVGRWYPPRGRASLVFCHGFPGRNLNEDLAAQLAALGWGVLLFSYRGVRDSRGEHTFRRTEEDIEAALAAVAERSPRGVGLLGYSMGGFAAMRVARRAPERLATLVLLAAVSDLRGLRRAWDARGAGSLERFFAADGGLVRGDAAARIREVLELEAEPQPTEFARAVDVPTFLVHGTRDERVPIEQSRLLRDELAGPAELVELDTDHDLGGMAEAIALAYERSNAHAAERRPGRS